MDVTELPIPPRSRSWRAKLAVKLLVGSVGVPYAWLRTLGLGRHGQMLDAEYAVAVVRAHVGDRLEPGAVALEIGPGDSVASGIVAAAMGAARTWLVDVGSFADLRPATYEALWRAMAEDGSDLRRDLPASPRELLEVARITYLTEGVRSFSEIPDGSVDLAWSHAVLEHVRRADLDRLFGELRRVLRSGARSSHRVDLRDHLSGGLRHLTIPSARWERPSVWRSGAYTNRRSMEEFVAAAQGAGLVASVPSVERWEAPPIRRSELAPEFQGRSDDDLRVAAFDLEVVAP